MNELRNYMLANKDALVADTKDSIFLGVDKEAIIILSSEGKIAFNNHKIVLIKKIDYKDFEGAIKDWIKCAFYLGVVFSKTTEDHLSFFLGVDTK